MPRFNFVILTPTYNRAQLLDLQIQQLTQEARTLREPILHIIVDDGSDLSQNYETIINRYRTAQFYTIHYRRLDKNNGRDEFWRTCNELFSMAAPIPCDCLVMTADDLELCRNFLKQIRHNFRFAQRQDRHCVCLNYFSRWPTNWNQSGRYEDGAFIATRKFFDVFRWRLDPIPKYRWEGARSSQYLSTGVHQQITRKLERSRFNIAKTHGISFARTRPCESALYPEEKFPGRAKKQKAAPLDIYIDD